MFFLKRKPGLSLDEFKQHFDRHVALSLDHYGPLMSEHHRSYPHTVRAGVRKEGASVAWPYDCISEWLAPDERSLDRIIAVLSDPVVGKELSDDAVTFLDQTATMMIRCGEVEVVSGRETLSQGAVAALAALDVSSQ